MQTIIKIVAGLSPAEAEGKAQVVIDNKLQNGYRLKELKFSSLNEEGSVLILIILLFSK